MFEVIGDAVLESDVAGVPNCWMRHSSGPFLTRGSEVIGDAFPVTVALMLF